ncbi:MAG: spore coat protein [Faecalimonas sp.]|nr:spore coat protein [Faecalimonas sp.]
MAQLSEKELSIIGDLLGDEELLTKKFKMLAAQTQDPEIKQKYERISEQHQGHYNALYEYLK